MGAHRKAAIRDMVPVGPKYSCGLSLAGELLLKPQWAADKLLGSFDAFPAE